MRSAYNTILYAELITDDETLRLPGVYQKPATYVTVDGIDGWYSTPTSKWTLTERSYMDGAYAIQDSEVVYSARTITMNVGILTTNREDVLARIDELKRFTHREVTLRVVDADHDLCCSGYATVTSEATWDETNNTMTMTIVCPDPALYATEGTSGVSRCLLSPSGSGITGGLYYGDDAAGLVYDLTYGTEDEEAGNIGTVSNGGNATAYPQVTVHGTLEGGFTLYEIVDGTRHVVDYGAPVTGTPIVLDYRLRNASAGGFDRSAYLTSRGFAGIPAGKSATFNLVADGSGWAEVEVRSTYI